MATSGWDFTASTTAFFARSGDVPSNGTRSTRPSPEASAAAFQGGDPGRRGRVGVLVDQDQRGAVGGPVGLLRVAEGRRDDLSGRSLERGEGDVGKRPGAGRRRDRPADQDDRHSLRLGVGQGRGQVGRVARDDEQRRGPVRQRPPDEIGLGRGRLVRPRPGRPEDQVPVLGLALGPDRPELDLTLRHPWDDRRRSPSPTRSTPSRTGSAGPAAKGSWPQPVTVQARQARPNHRLNRSPGIEPFIIIRPPTVICPLPAPIILTPPPRIDHARTAGDGRLHQTFLDVTLF